MILNWQEVKDPGNPFGGEVFRGDVMNTPSVEWESHIPDITSLSESAAADPALAASFSDDHNSTFGDVFSSIPNKLEPLMKHIGDIAMFDYVNGARQSMVQIVQTVGIPGNEFGKVANIFKADINAVTSGLDLVKMTLDSKVFGMAMDAIGAVPIVGWVIKIVYEIAKTIANAVQITRDEKQAVARKKIAQMLTIPINAVGFKAETDQAQTQAFFKKMGVSDEFDPTSIIKPAYEMRPNDPDMGFVASGVYDDEKMYSEGDASVRNAAGWVVHGGKTTGGFGYVPGSVSMTRSMFFKAGTSTSPNTCGVGCGAGGVRDMGTLYPTTQSLCTSWWSQVEKPGPMMFSVQPRVVKSLWEDYIERMFVLCQNVAKGWTCAISGIPFTDQFYCLVPELTCGGGKKQRKEGMGSCKKGRGGDKLRIPRDYGRDPHVLLYAHLLRLFFNIENPYSKARGGLEKQVPHTKSWGSSAGTYKPESDGKAKYWRPDAIDYSKSVPVDNLDKLYIKQKATLESLQCMYVNGRDTERFPAFKDSALRNLWNRSVTDVFSSGAWRRVVFQDMPDGDAKNAFYNYAKSQGIEDVQNFNRPCRPGEPMMNCMPVRGFAAMGRMPDNPSLPKAPPMAGAVLASEVARKPRRLPPGSRSSGKAKKSSAAPLVIGAAAAAFLLLKK